MHKGSMACMQYFIDAYLQPESILGVTRVLDVGSYNVNGCYRPLFTYYKYTGADVRDGPNVDIVLAAPYDWRGQIEDGEFDCVICGQTLEHVEQDVEFMRECVRVLKPNGLCCFVAPSAGYKHAEPGGYEDYRRYTPPELRALAEGAGLEVIGCGIRSWTSAVWQDCVLVARKPKAAAVVAAKRGEVEDGETTVASEPGRGAKGPPKKRREFKGSAF